ncbi:hypothetical protein [Comamonas testosteroni]|uniref:hypothetical protein n=1 Tax=Comamonas testosteroni TaxID=285 RepID=UPI0012D3525E|nr:hypothetical protein [Comamonas testosteroni]
MNSTTDNLIPWLDHLQVLMPPEHITLVGAGNGRGAWAQWLQTQLAPMTLVEADARQFAALQRLQSAGIWAEAALLHSAVAAEAGSAEFFTANLTTESGLLRPENLRYLWPNLRTELAESVQATTLAQLFQIEQAHRWLVLDCLPAAALLHAAHAALFQLDVVLARVVLATSNEQQPEGTSLAELAQALPDFIQLAQQPSRHPDISYALFVRDYRHAWQNATKSQIAEAKGKQVALQAHAQLQSQFQQAQATNEELLQKQALQAQAQQSLEADLAQAGQGLNAERKAKQAANEAIAQLQSQLQQAQARNEELLQKQAQQSQAQQSLEADLARAGQALNTERKAKQAANEAQVQLQSQLQQAQAANEELLQKQARQAHAQQSLEADLAQAGQALNTERKAKQAALEAQAQLQSQLQQAQAANEELLQKQAQQAQAQQSLEADLAQAGQALNTERKAKQAANEAQAQLQSQLQQARAANEELLQKQSQQAQALQSLEVDLAQASQELNTELKAKQVVLEAQVQLQSQLQQAHTENAELLKNQELEAQVKRALEVDLTRAQQALDATTHVKAQLQEQLEQAQKVQSQLKLEIGQKAEVQALFKQQADELIRVSKFLDTSIRKEIADGTRQMQAFAGLESYWRTGELPAASIEGHARSISPDFSLYVVTLLEQNNYDLVIEFGSGTSTVVIAKAVDKMAAKRGGRPPVVFASFDHLEEHHQKTLGFLQQAGLADCVQLHHAPLQEWQAPNGNIYPYYSCQETLAALAEQQVSAGLRVLVIVDGPDAGLHARYPAAPLVSQYFAGAQVDLLMDEGIHEDRHEIAQLWQHDLSASHITTR